ncbi:MAG: zinc-binding metallopeptidase family protein [Janthinobacterium lividum]
MKTFHCDHCGQQVFFENVVCGRCGNMLGYLSDVQDISTFEAVGNDVWRSLSPRAQGRDYRMCQNYAVENVCNWMIPAEQPNTLCSSCQLTHIIPALLNDQSRQYWYKLELAKRRLLYTLATLRVGYDSREQDPEEGLAFEFLQQMPGGEPVKTGHDNGLITLNVAEADDARREKIREQMNEPYRTLLGHFRHEIGHYYFMRFERSHAWLERFRQRFGDERADYGESLKRHYENGPPPQWEDNFISAYATSHPWEDWAETWAHYLHMVDALETAEACGLALLPGKAQEPVMQPDNTELEATSFERMIERWFPLTYVLNSLNRSLGMPDGYPFTLAPTVIDKLRFVHRSVQEAAEGSLQSQ